jgi:hypothetical protein
MEAELSAKSWALTTSDIVFFAVEKLLTVALTPGPFKNPSPAGLYQPAEASSATAVKAPPRAWARDPGSIIRLLVDSPKHAVLTKKRQSPTRALSGSSGGARKILKFRILVLILGGSAEPVFKFNQDICVFSK